MNILIVDDIEGVVDSLRPNIDLDDCCILDASSGLEALEIMRRGDPPIDIMVSDYRMPELNGVELLSRAIALKGDLYTIIFSAHDVFSDAPRWVKSGANEILPKGRNFHVALNKALRRGVRELTIERFGRELLSKTDTETILELTRQTCADLFSHDGVFIAVKALPQGVARVEHSGPIGRGVPRDLTGMEPSSAYLYVLRTGQAYFPTTFAPADEALEPMLAGGRGVMIAPIEGNAARGAFGIEVTRDSDPLELDDFRLLGRISDLVALSFQTHVRVTRHVKLKGESDRLLLAESILHEINNPLNNITTAAQLLSEPSTTGETPSDRFQQNLEIILRNADKMKGAIDALLRPELRASTDRSVLDIGRVLKEATALFNHDKPTGVEVVQNIEPSLPSIEADHRMLVLTFSNLLENGKTAVQGEGVLTIRAAYAPARDRVVIQFTDDGRGIPDEDVGRIWDYGFSSSGDGHVGCGLALTKNMVLVNGGSISVETEPGVGTTFELSFPVATNG